MLLLSRDNGKSKSRCVPLRHDTAYILTSTQAACAKVQRLSQLLEDYAARQCTDEYIIDMLTNMAEILGRSSGEQFMIAARHESRQTLICIRVKIRT